MVFFLLLGFFFALWGVFGSLYAARGFAQGSAPARDWTTACHVSTSSHGLASNLDHLAGSSEAWILEFLTGMPTRGFISPPPLFGSDSALAPACACAGRVQGRVTSCTAPSADGRVGSLSSLPPPLSSLHTGLGNVFAKETCVCVRGCTHALFSIVCVRVWVIQMAAAAGCGPACGSRSSSL